MADYTKSVPPILTAIADAAGLLTREWRAWFSARQTFDNSIVQRWVLHLTGPITVVSDTVLTKAGADNLVDYYPPGGPIRVRNAGVIERGVVTASAYDSGAGKLVLTITLDGGSVLSAVDQIFYSALASAVIP